MGCIPAFLKSKAFKESLERQTRGPSFSIYSRYMNVTVWNDNGLVFLVNNDFSGKKEKLIAAKVNDKAKKDYKGIMVVISFVCLYR